MLNDKNRRFYSAFAIRGRFRPLFFVQNLHVSFENAKFAYSLLEKNVLETQKAFTASFIIP